MDWHRHSKLRNDPVQPGEPNHKVKPADYGHCNRCRYTFQIKPNGQIDMKDFRKHRDACR